MPEILKTAPTNIMQWSVLLSALMHAFIVVVAYTGLPHLVSSVPSEPVIEVTLLPVSSKTNIKPKVKPATKPKQEKVQKQKKPPQPPTRKPELVEHQPVKKPDIVKKEPLLEKKPVLSPIAKPEKIAAPKQKPKKIKKKEELDMGLLLDRMEKEVQQKKATQKEVDLSALEEELSKTQTTEFDPTKSISISERALIKRKVEQYWDIDVGKLFAENYVVELDIYLSMNGDINKIEVVDTIRYSTDGKYRVAAEEAIRAVHRASPITGLSSDRYPYWKHIRVKFDPSEILGYR